MESTAMFQRPSEVNTACVQAISRGGVTLDEGIGFVQVTKMGRIRVTNVVLVDFETSKAHMHVQEMANNC